MKIVQNLSTEENRLGRVAFFAGYLHDTGKMIQAFQSWVSNKENTPEEPEYIEENTKGKFSFETNARHNEVSLLLLDLFSDESRKIINKDEKAMLRHCIFWHHRKPFRKNPIESITDLYNMVEKSDKVEILKAGFKKLILSINRSVQNYPEDLPDLNKLLDMSKDKTLPQMEEFSLPDFQDYHFSGGDFCELLKEIKKNTKQAILLSALVTADRLISGMDSAILSEKITKGQLKGLLPSPIQINGPLRSEIQNCLDRFRDAYPDSERNKKQSEVASKIIGDSPVAALKGPAGCGKTKIALEWALHAGANQIFWVCPRVQICQSIFEDLTSAEYLLNLKIELCTGEFKWMKQNGKITESTETERFSGNIVITTIDQILTTLTTHAKVTALIQFMDAHVIFDEFHEYIPMKGINLLFAELIFVKYWQKNPCKALLVSATPNPVFLKEILEIEACTSMESFNESPYEIRMQSFDEKNPKENPFYELQSSNTFVISNTAQVAQRSFLENYRNENSALFHSKYKKNDKKELFEEIFKSFQRNGNKSIDVLRSGPVVQASLNITCNQMISEITNPENILQRLGRLNRFAENRKISRLTIAYPFDFGASHDDSLCSYILKELFCFNTTKMWFNFIENNFCGETLTLKKIYELYDNFYENKECKNMVSEDLKKSFSESVQLIREKVSEPLSFPASKKGKKQLPEKKELLNIPKNSLRGDSYFVQMGILDCESPTEYNFREEYACPQNSNGSDSETLTMAKKEILKKGNSNMKLTEFMIKKHHNTVKGREQIKEEKILLKKAKSSETPIFVSYIPGDLNNVESQGLSHAVYYAVCSKQPIGIISLDKLSL